MFIIPRTTYRTKRSAMKAAKSKRYYSRKGGKPYSIYKVKNGYRISK